MHTQLSVCVRSKTNDVIGDSVTINLVDKLESIGYRGENSKVGESELRTRLVYTCVR